MAGQTARRSCDELSDQLKGQRKKSTDQYASFFFIQISPGVRGQAAPGHRGTQ
ncbi:hypothetical protein SAMN05421772_11219 [Paracoccus saliphilus]|uniref:Uncharacterized protein n=1 Tax=Paracoccus saliphilus TaxID=405559 RepID=A0AA45W698_9RHOB|nr:hypothetical protein SAMN05421772_11219 [Paracoccus saliphilus]